MYCEGWREAISARLDGEDPGLPTVMLDSHLESCGPCQTWAWAVAEMKGSARFALLEEPRDQTSAILSAAADRGLVGGDAGRAQQRWRWLLGTLAIVQLAVAAQNLLIDDGSGASVHLARELGSWDAALAVGYLFAAWRPSRAWGMLPLVAALVGCLMITSGVDVVEGHALLADEAAHLLAVAGLAALWLIGRRPARHRAPRLRPV